MEHDPELGFELEHTALDPSSHELVDDPVQSVLAERVREAVRHGSGGAGRVAELHVIMTDRELDDEQRLALRAGMRESAVDGEALREALAKRSPAAVADVIDRSTARVDTIYETRRAERTIEQEQARAEQTRVVGFVNAAETTLPPRDRARIESALGDGRVNLRTIETMLANGGTSKVIELAQELDEEHEAKRSRGRSLRRE